MNFIKYIIYAFKNRKHIQKQNWNIWAYERTLEQHVRELEELLQTKIWDIRKYNYLTHKELHSYESIQLKKSDIVRIFDNIQAISCVQEEPCWERTFVHECRKYMYK